MMEVHGATGHFSAQQNVQKEGGESTSIFFPEHVILLCLFSLVLRKTQVTPELQCEYRCSRVSKNRSYMHYNEIDYFCCFKIE